MIGASAPTALLHYSVSLHDRGGLHKQMWTAADSNSTFAHAVKCPQVFRVNVLSSNKYSIFSCSLCI